MWPISIMGRSWEGSSRSRNQAVCITVMNALPHNDISADAFLAKYGVRNMQRKRQVYQEYGYNGLFDRRRSKKSDHRVPMETAGDS
jgi:hypothetical protein